MYDNLGRLTKSYFGEGPEIELDDAEYTETFQYDVMGNVTRLTRYGRTDDDSYFPVDGLRMTYEGNRLVKVSDEETDNDPTCEGVMQFTDNVDLAVEYEYDENGNMTKDLKIPIKREQSKLVCSAEREEFGMKFNRNISKIEYNCLNLPEKTIILGDGMRTYIDNTYDAAGNKLRTTVGRQRVIGPFHPFSSGGVAEPQGGGIVGPILPPINQNDPQVVTDYCGNMIYRNDTLTMLLTEEGYVTFDERGEPLYHYYLRDHLGSVRVVFDQTGTVEQVNDYYPSGTLMYTSTNGTVQPYKFGQKELERTLPLDEYDFGARWMDPVVGGRFTTMDPLCEKYYSVSPYAYCGGDPVNLVDPSGRKWEDPQEAQKLKGNIENRIENLQNSISKMEDHLSDPNLSNRKREKLERKISEKQEMVSNLNKSLQDIDMLGDEEETVFRFEHTDGGRHNVYSPEPGLVVIQTSSDAFSIHEITHIAQSAFFGGAVYSNNGFLMNPGLTDQRDKEKGQDYIIERMFQMEIESYQRQYSYDLSFPFSIKGLYDINATNIRRIKDEKGEYVYKWTNLLK